MDVLFSEEVLANSTVSGKNRLALDPNIMDAMKGNEDSTGLQQIQVVSVKWSQLSHLLSQLIDYVARQNDRCRQAGMTMLTVWENHNMHFPRQKENVIPT